jgi:hypothetical protein
VEIRDNTKPNNEDEDDIYNDNLPSRLVGNYEEWKKSHPSGTINEYYASLRNNK